MASTPQPRETPPSGDGVASRRWRFGSAVLDEASLELRIGDRVVEAEPKCLEVLLHLLYRAGEVVTKDELLDAVWPGRIVTEGAVTRTLGRLREALGDTEQALIKTVHGYGWRLVAPVAVEAIAGRAPPKFDFKAGEAPHLRPDWRLVECLGRGGHGEVWLARNPATQEGHVFKYAYDAAALISLKREITLNRLLREGLGGDAGCVRILQWNLEEPPYFIEAEYVSGGSLETWTAAQGGAASVPLPLRLELAAQVADALAAAHSMGVLHKDLKPSNVMVEAGPSPRIKLADFGSGGVLDLQRLQALGITRHGFTQTVGNAEPGGTPLYLAPEVVAGQPASVKADVFALGVILYQLVIGDLRKPLAPGWEQDVEDELLRRDIAEAASGNPARRLADAAQLAQRLRALEARRQQSRLEQLERERTERARAEAERDRLRRGWVHATMVSLVLGIAASLSLALYAFRARHEALQSRDAAQVSAATAQAVTDFLNRDLLSQADPRQSQERNLTVNALIDRAAPLVDARFRAQPEAAAQVHLTLGESYYWLGQHAPARTELEKALALLERTGQSSSVAALRARTDLAVVVYLDTSGVERSVALLDEALKRGEGLGRRHPQMIEAASLRATLRVLSPEFDVVAGELRELLGEIGLAGMADERAAQTYFLLGVAEENLSDHAQADRAFSEAIRLQGAAYGNGSFLQVVSRIWRTIVLATWERLDEADAELAALKPGLHVVPQDSLYRAFYYYACYQARLSENRLAEADACLDDNLRVLKLAAGPDSLEVKLRDLSIAVLRQRQGRLAEAERLVRRYLETTATVIGPLHYETVGARAVLADVLREEGRDAEALQVVRGAQTGKVQRMSPPPIHYADLRRVEGLLLRKAGKADEARAALGEALKIYEERMGPGRISTERLRKELNAS